MELTGGDDWYCNTSREILNRINEFEVNVPLLQRRPGKCMLLPSNCNFINPHVGDMMLNVGEFTVIKYKILKEKVYITDSLLESLLKLCVITSCSDQTPPYADKFNTEYYTDWFSEYINVNGYMYDNKNEFDILYYPDFPINYWYKFGNDIWFNIKLQDIDKYKHGNEIVIENYTFEYSLILQKLAIKFIADNTKAYFTFNVSESSTVPKYMTLVKFRKP